MVGHEIFNRLIGRLLAVFVIVGAGLLRR